MIPAQLTSGAFYLFFIQRAIEESKKTALREERARRHEKRMLQKKGATSGTCTSSGLENDDGVCSPSKNHQEASITELKVS